MEEVREATRSIMKQMVKRAVLPSPIKTSVSMAELERAHMVLLQACVSRTAEEQTGIRHKIGMYSG
jgi:hypothetical protein